MYANFNLMGLEEAMNLLGLVCESGRISAREGKDKG
jgi:hypothetical protein